MNVHIAASGLNFHSSAIAPDDPAPAGYHRGGLAPWQIKRVLAHIAACGDQPTRVADLAALSRLSVSHFARAFRLSFAVSPATMIRRHRLQRAKTLMLTSELPLCEIALICGFSDQSHMSRLFRRHLDMPPAQWRQRTLRATAPAVA